MSVASRAPAQERPRPGDLPGVGTLLEAAVSALGGTTRPGQQQMAEAVAEAMDSGRHLLVQAGTGTGKSLAYLVPAIAHAMGGRGPVVISTATLALQAQVVERDLPRLADALEPLLGRRPTWQLVKGRANYLCRHKLDGGYPPEDEGLFEDSGPVSVAAAVGRVGAQVVRLREWAESTTTGDRDQLVPGVSDAAWRQVSVTARECLGAAGCPVASACHCDGARDRAREVDVVVTNHAIVAIDAFEGRNLLPEHDVLVLDEAHELVDRVTSVVSKELTVSAVELAARRVRSCGVPTTGLDDAAAALGAALEEVGEGRLVGLPQDPAALGSALEAVRDAARDLLSALRSVDGSGESGADGGKAQARAAVEEVFGTAERLVCGSSTDDGVDVTWLARQPWGSGVRTSLVVAPLSVAASLREQVFATRTVVATSATLAIGGSFDPPAAMLGLPVRREAEALSWQGLDVGSPFDYPRQGILYIARQLPPPGRDGMSPATLDEIVALVEAAGGRTLGLFSSRRAAEAASAALRERVDLTVLCQGDDATPTLVRMFAEDPRSCLFGTLSLWQGVDVPGPSCQLVLIDRLPFPRPDDPLATARQRAVARAGGNGFMSVAASQAALLLAQGAGRLIRATTDRGVVAVLDSRLSTARYGSYIRASLPPFWTTTDREVVLAALRRVDS